MSVQQFAVRRDKREPYYRWRIDVSVEYRDDVAQWVKDMNIACTLCPTSIYLTKGEDVTFFLLRWGCGSE